MFYCIFAAENTETYLSLNEKITSNFIKFIVMIDNIKIISPLSFENSKVY